MGVIKNIYLGRVPIFCQSSQGGTQILPMKIEKPPPLSNVFEQSLNIHIVATQESFAVFC